MVIPLHGRGNGEFTFTCGSEPSRPQGLPWATTLRQSLWWWNRHQPEEKHGRMAIWTPVGTAGRRRGAFLPAVCMEMGVWSRRHGSTLGTVSSNRPVSTQTVFLWTPLKAILSRPIASWASVPSIQTQRPHYTRRAGTHIRISKGPFHSFHLLLWLKPPRSDSPPPLSPLDFTACSPVRSTLSDHPPCAHSRGSLSCPLCPSRSHSPSEAQGPSPESTALTLQGRASPPSSFYNTLCRCHYFTDAADGLKRRLCTGTSRVVPVRELRTEPARRTVPTSFSPLTSLLRGKPLVPRLHPGCIQSDPL